MKIKLKQHVRPLGERRIETMGNLIILLPEKAGVIQWSSFPFADLLKARLDTMGDNSAAAPLVTDLPNKSGTRVSLVGLKPEASSFDLLALARRLVDPHLDRNPTTIALYLPGFDTPSALRAARSEEHTSELQSH